MKTLHRLAPLLLLALPACGDRAAGGGEAAPGDTTPITAIAEVRQPPRLANADSVRAALAARYPADLRARGVGGETVLMILVSQDGIPLAVEVAQSSGQSALDQASVHVANVMRFEPARSEQGPAKVWVKFPVRWVVPGAARPAAPADSAAPPR